MENFREEFGLWHVMIYTDFGEKSIEERRTMINLAVVNKNLMIMMINGYAGYLRVNYGIAARNLDVNNATTKELGLLQQFRLMRLTMELVADDRDTQFEKQGVYRYSALYNSIVIENWLEKGLVVDKENLGVKNLTSLKYVTEMILRKTNEMDRMRSAKINLGRGKYAVAIEAGNREHYYSGELKFHCSILRKYEASISNTLEEKRRDFKSKIWEWLTDYAQSQNRDYMIATKIIILTSLVSGEAASKLRKGLRVEHHFIREG